jgi:HAE1 family hydrophobic/amphiphilic exporter-1
MAHIVETSIKRPLLILVIFTVLTLGGFVCYNLLNLNLLPKLELPTITVATIYPGAGASEVETSVTKKIEDALSSLENLKKVSSISQEGASIVVIQFNEGTDIDRSVQDAQRKINVIKSDLPGDILDPSVNKISADEQPIMKIAAFSSLPATEFYKLVEDRVQPRLAKLPGVGAVNLVGGNEREIKVNIDVAKLKAYRLSILQVLQAIQTANVEIPAGNIKSSAAVYSVRLSAKYSNLDELRNTVVMTSVQGGEVKVADVAEVEDGIAEQQFINRIDGQDAIGISIQKQSDANAVQVADLAKAELAAIEKEYAESRVKFEIASDDSVFTRASANAVVADLFLAILIVTFICFIFLHNLRSAIIIMVAVPLSIIPAFIAMYFMGYSLNMMSLMALSLVVGILVDDSIVVVENMFLHLERGKSKWDAAIDGCKSIMFTCVSITLVLVIVFLPLAIFGGLIGNLLKEFAMPIIITVMCSLLVSFTVTPLLMSRFGKLPDDTRQTLSARFSRFIERLFDSLQNAYGRLLTVGLKHKVTVLVTTVALLIASFALFPLGLIGVAFVPNTDQGEFTVSLEMNPQVTVHENNQMTMQVEKIIRSKPEVVRVYTNIGVASTGLSLGSAKNNVAAISVKMVDKEQRTIDVYDFSQQLKEDIMQQIPGIRARVSVSMLGQGSTTEPIQLIVQGADFNQVQQSASMILDAVRKTPGTTDAKFSIDDPRQEVQIRLDRDRMSQMGLSAAEVGTALRVALAGNDDSKYTDGNFEYDIRIGVDDFDKTQAEDVAGLTFINRKGEIIELNQIADISYGLGPSTLERTDRISSITVKSNVVGRPSGTVGAEILSAIEGKTPSGISVKAGGMMEQQDSAFGALGFAFLAAIVLIYLIMVALYNSLLDPIVVLVSIPLSLIGAFLALALTMNSLSIFSIIGLIVLIGLVAKNAILLVDFTNNIRREGNADTFSALIEAGRQRLRPILMTAFSTIFGMLPLALASGDGAELKNGMAWVIIGGLTSSMILTLVVVPVVYYSFDRLAVRISFLRNKRTQRSQVIKKMKLNRSM